MTQNTEKSSANIVYTDPRDDDEIDLRELVRTLLNHKRTIIVTASIITLGAIGYALLATPVYKATAAFLPPTEADTAHLSVPDLYTPDNEELYRQFSVKLGSRQVYRQVFDKLNILNHYIKSPSEDTNIDNVFNQFVENVNLERPQIKRGQEDSTPPNLFLSVQDIDPETAAQIANNIASTANLTLSKETTTDLNERIKLRRERLNKDIADLRALIEKDKADEIKRIREADELKRKEIKEQIKALRLTATQLRQDRIQVLEEAAATARGAGIFERIDSTRPASTDQNPTIYTEISTQQQPLYYRGEKALRAEIDVLQKRESDVPFTPEIRDLQKQLALLEENNRVQILLERQDNDPFIESLREKQIELEYLANIEFDPEQVSMASFDQPAFPPASPIKPNRKMIVALGLVLGLFLGIIAAFMLSFWRSLETEGQTKNTS